MTDLRNEMNRGGIAPHDPAEVEKQNDGLLNTAARADQRANQVRTESGSSTPGATLTLRVTEARVEDVGHAIARLAPADLQRLGARAGDIVKITGATTAVGRAELSDRAYEGMIQIDGTCRSNCSAGLQEQVSVAPIQAEQAVAVRFSPMWIGAAPARVVKQGDGPVSMVNVAAPIKA